MGRWVRVPVTEWIEGIPVRSTERVYREHETPACALCEDYGEWIGEASEPEPCPDCTGTLDRRSHRD